jgi:NTE family protein
MFDQFQGQTLDPQALKAEVGALYGRGDLEMLDYRLVQDPMGQLGLDFSARRNSWGPNYLRFGVSLEDDFKGQTIFNAAARLDMTELNSLGAEWVSDLQVGTAPLLATELYLPLSNVARYFVAPHADIEAHDVAQVVNDRQVGDFRVSSVDYGVDFGRELANWGEVRVGAVLVRDSGSQRAGIDLRRDRILRSFRLRHPYQREFSAQRPGAHRPGQCRGQQRR